MTIDERIQALTMNLELMSRDHEDFRKRMEEQTANINKQAGNIDKLVGIVERLADIAGLHERRLTDLEGGAGE